MSWASYEPMQSMQPQAPPVDPTMMGGQGRGPQQLPSMMPHQLAARPPVTDGTKGPQVPSQKQEKSSFIDISEDDNPYDWIYITIAVIIVEICVIGLVRFYPDIFGKWVNIWYNRFKLSAVLADVIIILLGFAISRYIYSEYLYKTYDWNPLYFTGTTMGVQLLHDILFYIGVIRPIPTGHNSMIDVFKEYAASGGAKILAADSMMVAASSGIAMLLKNVSVPGVSFIGLLALYVVPYILETRNNFSSIV